MIDAPAVSAHRGQILLVLGNVIKNAIQAMPLGGNLTVSARCTDGAVVASVSDTGEGLPPEHLERVFEPFFSTRARGIGLGLAIAKVLTEQNGGAIGVETAAGQGTRVSVRFPPAAAEPPSTRES